MAFSQVILGEVPLGGAKMFWGTFNCSGVTTGTIDIRGQLPVGTAVKIPYRLVGGNVHNCTSATAPNCLWSENGTVAITTTSGDTGTWFILVQ